MIKKEFIFEYLRTIVWTLLAILVSIVIMLAVLQHNVYESQDKIVTKEDKVEYYLVGVLIEKNKYLAEQYPKNYRINLKLGMLYEIARDYKNSEIQYKLAISKAPYEDFKPQYKLANLYIRLNRLNEAQELMDNILDRPDKQLIEYKANVFYKLGDKYYNSADYANAIVRYEKALTYFQALKSTQCKFVENSIASAYVYLAEEYVSNMQIDDAINALEIANSIVKAPIIKYKLGLLLAKNDPDKANEYFEAVFKEEPSILDFEGYYKFLNYLAQRAQNEGDTMQGELFKFKAKRFKNYYESNVLTIQDISVDSIKGNIIYNGWRKKYKMNLIVKLKNSSNQEMKSLFLYIIFKKDGQMIDEYTKQVISPDKPLGAGQLGPIISIRTTNELDETTVEGGQITAEVFASKSEKSYQLALAKLDLKEPKEDPKNKSKLNKFFDNLKSVLTGFSHELP